MTTLAGRILGTLALLSAGCAPAPEPQQSGGPARYAITGTIVEQRDASRITLAHDAIEDYMPAMVMDVQGDNLGPLRPGDRIRATLVVTGTATRLIDVAVVTAGTGRRSMSERNAPADGASVPDVLLRNQFDRPIRLSDFRGRVLVVTFIYTRCPLPDFCPRLMRNFQELDRALAIRPRLRSSVHMLGVSIDPEFDTPDVLRAYGEARLGGKKAFERLDLATGQFEEVVRMADFFGLRFEPAAGQISHTIVTAIVSPEGHLVKRFPEMMWNLDEAIAIAEREAGDGD